MHALPARHTALSCVALVVALAWPAGARAEAKLGDELLTNGGFEKLDAKGSPAGWRCFPDVKIRQEGGKTWIEIPGYGSVAQDIAIDPAWMKIKVSFRMRVTNVRRGDEGWKNARLAMEFRDAADKHVDPWPNVLWAEGTTDWRRYERVFPIPQGAVKLVFSPSMLGQPGGKAEYDDVSVTLARLRVTKKEDLPAPAGYAEAWDLSDAWRRTSATRESVCLNGLWRFLPVPESPGAAPPQGPAGWGWIKVPGDWPSTLDNAAQDLLLSPYMEDRTDLARLDQAWYLRELSIPPAWKGRRVAVELAMLQTHARVFVDGQAAGEIFFPGGQVDLTRLIQPGKVQTLAVLVTARPLAKETTAFMAPDRMVKEQARIGLRGLTGDVLLTSAPAGETLDDVRITTSTRDGRISIDAAILNGKDAKGRRALRVSILEAGDAGKAGKAVKTFASPPADGRERIAAAADWPDAKRWDIDTPGNLYDAVVSLADESGKVLDETLPIRFGFREFRIDGRDFYLNDRRVHLRALLSRNINHPADLACIEACRTTCRRLKHYGFNFAITSNYHFQPGTVGYMDGFYDAADQEGLLTSFSLPHFNDFTSKLDDPKQAARYRALCDWLIRRVRNHPSIVLYAMSHNACGYHGDQNPMRIDGVYDPEDPAVGGSPNRNRAQARIAAKIAHSLDATRPVYHHEAGNLGDVYTLNIYLNWAPMQERSDWLEHWATKGVKPLFFVEWGLPHISSWSSYRGPNFIWTSPEYQSVWDAEYNAAYLGDAAYELTPQRIRSRELEEELWAQGKPFAWAALISHFRDDPEGHVRMMAMFADDNWRCLRAWGISAMLPWDQEQIWQKTGKWHPDAEAFGYEPNRLKQPGVVPDRIHASDSWLEHYDPAGIAPTALGKSFLRWNQPLCGFIGGGPGADDFTDKAHNFTPGETIRKQLVLLNDTRQAVTCKWAWRFFRVDQPKRGVPDDAIPVMHEEGQAKIEPGGKTLLPVQIILPGDVARRAHMLVATFDFSGVQQTDTFRIDVLAKPTPEERKSRIALFDPKGMTAKLLDRLGVKYDKVGADADVSKYRLLVLGREAIELDNKLPDVSAVRDGLNVFVFEQTADVLANRLGFRVNVHGLRRVFPCCAPFPWLPYGVLWDWRGSATLTPPYLSIEGVEKTDPQWGWCGFRNTRVWRCGNRGSVASVLIEKPPVGDFRPLLDGGFDRQYAPVLEYAEGKGRVVFCQLDVTGRTEEDPGAMHLCGALLSHIETGENEESRPVLYAGDAAMGQLLRQLGVASKPYAGGKIGPRAILVVGPGAKDLAGLAKQIEPRASVLCLGLSGKEIDSIWPGKLGMQRKGLYGDPVGHPDGPTLPGLSDAERQWRTKLMIDTADGSALYRFRLEKDGWAVLCQVAPWMLDYKAKPYLRTSYRRNVFLVSRLLHNLGAEAKTPLLERLSSPGAVPEFVLPPAWKAQLDPKDAGRKAEWWQPGLDDAKWHAIRVPGMFDEQLPGITPEYNGLCWYRLRFRVPANLKAEGLKLRVGPVDDESWVWLNGRFLGEVTKKTNPKDYWTFPREYPMPPGLLNRDGQNVLVVLVNDTYLSGGLTGTPALVTPGAWLNGYYVQEPVAGDDPYRYYRW